jgi:hypothetical protein
MAMTLIRQSICNLFFPLVIALGVVGVTEVCAGPSPSPALQGELIAPADATNAVPVISKKVSMTNGPLTLAVIDTPPKLAPEMKDYTATGFDKLASFSIRVMFEMTNPVTFATSPKLSGPIPDRIQSYDGRNIAMQGFMLPLKFEEGRVKDFLLMRSRAFCCYGRPLALNEWVSVHMTDKGVQSIMDQPVTLYGRLHVGAIRENGQISGIYRMDATRMDGP